MMIEEICAILPHRYPFLLIDRVISCEPGQSIQALKNVTVNEPFFQGHFPSHPVMPGVLITEAMAQACGLLLAKSSSETQKKSIYYLAGIDQARFRAPVVPGDTLMIHAEVLVIKRSISKYACRVMCDDKLVAQAELMCAKADIEV